MESFRTKLIICIFAFAVGATCFYLWNSHRVPTEPKAGGKDQPSSAPSSEAVVSNTPNTIPVSSLPQGPISQVDFRNFAYPKFSGKGHIGVKDGELEYETDGCLQRYSVLGVDYLDFTGDSEDEALVRVGDHMACGSSWASGNYYVYTMRNGRPLLLWKFATGSEAHGGEKDFRIEGKELVFELYGKWRTVRGELIFKENREVADDCCPTHYTIYRVAWDGMRSHQKSVEVLPFTNRSIY